MPFGHEQKEWAERKEHDIYEQKTQFNEFITVKAMMRKDGNVIPTTFTWEDQEIKIEKVLKVQQGSSLKETGIAGTRFLCQAMNRRFYLYYTGRQWYIDL
ncbi:MAG: hypothetical protein K0R50_450 [Eubacterium sp.]|jgi:hypothetical protein|nr:hypothetical protein [Eubacterium sp.]